jgi:hypothetical protein
MRIFFKKILHGINVILVITVVVVCGIHVKKRTNNAVSSFQTMIEKRKKERVTTQIPPKGIEWQLFWEKSPDVAGGNPGLRTFNSEVKILTNDTRHFVFIQYYQWKNKREEAYFFWDRTETYGVWIQESPPDNGKWWLMLDPGSTDRYHGGQSDRRSTKFIPMWLVSQKR